MDNFESRPRADWYVDEKTDLDALDEVFYSYYKELSDFQAARNINSGIKMQMVGGKKRFLPHQVYSLNSGMEASATFVTIVKLGENGVKKAKDINFKDIVDALKEGWYIPMRAEPPSDPYTDKEIRKCPRPQHTPDRLEPWNPHHLRRFFPVGFDIMMNAGVDYKPGDFQGNTPSGRDNKDNISRIKHFLPPADTGADVRSATSCGHDIVHPRPDGVKAGWGQFDTFYEWQAHGRVVDKAGPRN